MCLKISKKKKKKKDKDKSETHELIVQTPPPLADDEDESTDAGEVLTFSQVVGLVRPIFRILQLLCENHNKLLREYLREQPDNIRSINLIKEVANYLSGVYTIIDDESIEVIVQVLETLNEFIMGNVENQLVLFDSNGKFFY